MESRTKKIEGVCRDLTSLGAFAAVTVGEALLQLTDFDSEDRDELLIAAATLDEIKKRAEATAKKVREIAAQ